MTEHSGPSPSSRKPSISVITVVFNNHEGFRRTAESVVQQIGTNWEWIVIDGGSEDGTAELVRQYSDHMSFWCSEPDGGIYDAMNKGIANANGDFIVFMNSGDRFAENFSLQRVRQTIDDAPSDIGMVLGAARFELSPTYSYVQMPRLLDPYVRHSLPTSHQAMYFRTELHRQALFDPKIRIAADYDAICRMYKLNDRAAYVHEVVAVVWRGLESNSLCYPIANMRDMASTQRRVLHLSYPRVLASMVRRAMPVVAYRLMSYRWTSGITSRLITALRPEANAGRS